MPEANVLYGVTAVVVVGLVAWVAFVLRTAKEPWARAVAASPSRAERAPDVPVEKEPIADDEAADKAPQSEEAKDEEKKEEEKVEEEKGEEKKEEAKA